MSGYRNLEIAEGSLLELESQGEVAKEVEYWDDQEYEEFTRLSLQKAD